MEGREDLTEIRTPRGPVMSIDSVAFRMISLS